MCICISEEGMFIVRRKRGEGRGMHDPPVRELVQATIHIFHRLTSLKKI